jgi:hypothetical protein
VSCKAVQGDVHSSIVRQTYAMEYMKMNELSRYFLSFPTDSRSYRLCFTSVLKVQRLEKNLGAAASHKLEVVSRCNGQWYAA